MRILPLGAGWGRGISLIPELSGEIMEQEQLLKSLRRHLPEMLDELERMVGINSFTANPVGVDAVGAVTAHWFGGLGFKPEFVPSMDPRFGRHLVLKRPGRKGRALAFVSHLDTVYSPEEEERNNFVWRQEGDRIYGPGTLDIKGGTAMIWLILRALSELEPEIWEDWTWLILLNSSEEVLSKDFGALCLARMGAATRAALVFEAGGKTEEGMAAVTARKGRATLTVTAEGRAAHSGSQHFRGANAIVQLGQALERIHQLTDYGRGLTFNVGTVAGGTVVNRVPHLASAEIEMRAFSRQAHQEGLAAIRSLDGWQSVASAFDGFRCTVRVRVDEETPPWPRNAETDRLFEIWRAAAEELGHRLEREERGGVSDGNYVCHEVPALDGLGPAGDNAHCSERSADGCKVPEYLEVSSFVPRAAMSVLAITRLSREMEGSEGAERGRS